MASVGKIYLSITLGFVLFGFSSWTAAQFLWDGTADPDIVPVIPPVTIDISVDYICFGETVTITS